MRISKKAFAAWLAERPREKFRIASILRCPLAKFTGKPQPQSDTTAWAKCFIRQVDDSGRYYASISGAAALRILEKL